MAAAELELFPKNGRGRFAVTNGQAACRLGYPKSKASDVTCQADSENGLHGSPERLKLRRRLKRCEGPPSINPPFSIKDTQSLCSEISEKCSGKLF